MFFVSGCIWMMLVILHDTQDMRWLYKFWPPRNKEGDAVETPLDTDVVRELAKVDAMSGEQIEREVLVAKHLKKSYGTVKAVKDATFVLDR